MSLLLPPASHAAREMFDVAHLAEICSPANRGNMLTLRNALIQARRTFDATFSIKGLNVICMNAAGEVLLLSIGKRGGKKVAWNFGKL